MDVVTKTKNVSTVCDEKGDMCCEPCSDDGFFCGSDCCKKGRQECVDKTCCDPYKICGKDKDKCYADDDSCLESGECCKTTEICGDHEDRCCTEEECFKGVCYPKDSACGDDGCISKYGTTHCVHTTQICVTSRNSSGKEVSGCKNADTGSWLFYHYDSESMNGVDVCEKNGKLLSCFQVEGVPTPYNRSASVVIDPARSKYEVCNCVAKINERGLEFVDWDGQTCKGEFNCVTCV